MRRWGFWVALAVAALFLWLFLRNTDFRQMGQALKDANYVFLIPALTVFFLGIWFRALRWRMLLRPVCCTSSSRLFPLVVIGFMVNNILPGRVGLVARAYLLSEKEKVSKMGGAATLVTENVVDGVALVFIMAAVATVVPWNRWSESVVLSMAALFVVAFLVLSFLAFGRVHGSILFRISRKLLPERWTSRLSSWLERFLDGLAILRSPSKLVPIFLVSLMVWVCEAGAYYFVALSFSLGLSFQAILVVTALASMAWPLIVISPGGLGTFDYLAKEALKLFGVGGTLATSYVTVLHALLVLPVIVVGLVFLWWQQSSLAEITSASRRPAPVPTAGLVESERDGH